MSNPASGICGTFLVPCVLDVKSGVVTGVIPDPKWLERARVMEEPPGDFSLTVHDDLPPQQHV